MSNVIKLKNNNILGTIPTTSNLEAGELAINTASGRLYTEINDNEIVEVGPHPVFDTIAEAEVYFPLVGDICYINETSSNYKYIEYISDPPTVNEKNILITGQGGNTRWIATILSTTVAPLLKFFIGMTIEEPDFTIISNGTTVTLTLQAVGGGDITYSRPDGSIDVFDCTPAQTIALTPGTDTNYIQNWFYIDSPTNTLVANTTGFPTTEHVKLGNAILQSAATIQSEGKVRGGHNYSDHVFSPLNNGHGSHTNHAFRVRNGVYLDGLDFSHFGSGTATLNIGIATGKITQAHDHDTPTFASGSDFIVVNQSFDIENNLYNITTDADNNTNINRYAAYFIFIVFYEGGSNIYINKPSETYLNEADAIEGVVYNYPSDFRGTMYPVHVLVARRGASSITIYDDSSVDMRGKIVDAIAGGGSGIVPSHGDNHVNGIDDIQLVTETTKGLMPPNDQATELGKTGNSIFNSVSVQSLKLPGGSSIINLSGNIPRFYGSGGMYLSSWDGSGVSSALFIKRFITEGLLFIAIGKNFVDPTAQLHVKGPTSLATDIALQVDSTSGTILSAKCDGSVSLGNDESLKILNTGDTSYEQQFIVKVQRGDGKAYINFLTDTGDVLLRFVSRSLITFTDAVECGYFQSGLPNGNCVFSGANGTTYNRLAFIVSDIPTNNAGILFTDLTAPNTPPDGYFGIRQIGGTRKDLLITYGGETIVGSTIVALGKLHIKGDIGKPIVYITGSDDVLALEILEDKSLLTSGPRIVDAGAAITGDYTVLNTDKEIIYGNPTGSDKDWTLPTSPTENGKRTYVNVSDTYSIIFNGGGKKVAGSLDLYTIGPGLSETFHYTTAFGHTRI